MSVSIRPLDKHNLPEADRIFRFTFGVFRGLPDPMSFTSDAYLVKTRWPADPAAARGAYIESELRWWALKDLNL